MNPRVAAGAAPRCAGEHIKQVYFWFSCFFISRFSAEQSALAATVSQPPNRRHASCYKTATETAEAGQMPSPHRENSQNKNKGTRQTTTPKKDNASLSVSLPNR